MLAYPKFRLQAADRERLLEDLLPWCESWTAAIPSSTHRVRDSHDQVFPPAPWPSRANCGGHRLPSPVFVFIGTLLWSILIERMSP